MHWPSHVKAFKAHWIRRYLDPREGPWKQVVDYYIADVNIRRAIVVAKFSDSSPRCVHTDLPHKATHLRACFKAFEELRVEQDTSSVGPHIAALETDEVSSRARVQRRAEPGANSTTNNRNCILVVSRKTKE